MKIDITVILPTYNPNQVVISEVLAALKTQSFPLARWELLVIDNRSTNGVISDLSLSWHPNSSIVKEDRLGLTFARLCGFEHALGEIIVMVDDDNLLAPGYLQTVFDCFKKNSRLGCIGGSISGLFKDYQPPEWTKQFWPMLAIRNLGDLPLFSEATLTSSYPGFAPVGAGMAIRKCLLERYINYLNDDPKLIADRTGHKLSSGGDNEINIHILKQKYAVGYLPDLSLQHVIPEGRLTKRYLSKLNYESSKSWVALLLKYQICPWTSIYKSTVIFRKIKAWVHFKAWKSAENYIKWRGACGIFDALGKN